MVYKFCDKKASATPASKFVGGAIENKIVWNKELAEKIHKQLLKNLKIEKYSNLLKKMFEVLFDILTTLELNIFVKTLKCF